MYESQTTSDSVCTITSCLVTGSGSDTDSERERSRVLAQASATAEQLRRIQEVAQETNLKAMEEARERASARAFAQKAETQEQLRRIKEDADQKSQARRESELERQRGIELAVTLAEEERLRRIKEDKQRGFKNQMSPDISGTVDDCLQDMTISSPLGGAVNYNFNISPTSPSLSDSSPDAALGSSSPSASPPFTGQSPHSAPEIPSRKVKKTRGRARSIGPVSADSSKMRRKARKNSRERQRRVELNEQFEKLSSILNVDRKGKVRKTSILLEAINVIGSLRSENSFLRSQQSPTPKSKRSSRISRTMTDGFRRESTPPTTYSDIPELESQVTSTDELSHVVPLRRAQSYAPMSSTSSTNFETPSFDPYSSQSISLGRIDPLLCPFSLPPYPSSASDLELLGGDASRTVPPMYMPFSDSGFPAMGTILTQQTSDLPPSLASDDFFSPKATDPIPLIATDSMTSKSSDDLDFSSLNSDQTYMKTEPEHSAPMSSLLKDSQSDLTLCDSLDISLYSSDGASDLSFDHAFTMGETQRKRTV